MNRLNFPPEPTAASFSVCGRAPYDQTFSLFSFQDAVTFHQSRHGLLVQIVRLGAIIVMIGGLLLVAGCTTFNREWAKAENAPAANGGILGRWEGTWSSEVNGHNGNLRCLIRPKQDGTYNARFHAIYRKVLGFGYTVPLAVTETNGVFEFHGEANLGWWAGGVYHYEGHVKGMDFFATYRCKYDHGTFEMRRATQSLKGN